MTFTPVHSNYHKTFLYINQIYRMDGVLCQFNSVDNIERVNNQNKISCNIYIMPQYPDFPDELRLYLPEDESESIQACDFSLTPEELLKWEQYLLAKGCDYRLKDNPYLE